eukprot:CAMPEP_0197541388 /NCGR_PEP_ID=MMETSP1318-20131121/67131_1 /TAXON_ID=552666 /ORGANISM="Partenskyella glossopodia, Strain RCC365" /LENGTH=652 /DNA_ID=CAMNT_0043100557 /DNA_START=962 /DNA_END=2920 /DNA_ORIENTATION=+
MYIIGYWSRCIVTELVHRGSLFGLLHDEDSKLSWPRRLRIASDLACGMNYLHNFDTKDRIIHRDLKSLNVLITQEWRAKVADFGMTRFQDNNNVMTTCGTPLWMAPEIIRRKEYNYKVDVYSYGIVLWELYTRKIPYKSLGIPAKYLVKKVAMELLRPRIPQNCPQLYAELMQQCWTNDPKQRPRFSDIVRVCEAMLKDPNVVTHHPANEVCVAKATDQEEQNSIVANFEVGRWQFEKKEVEIGTELKQNGSLLGGNSTTFTGKLRGEKIRITEFKIGEEKQKAVHSELDEISNLRHPRLLLFLGAYFEENSFGVLTEEAAHDNLNNQLLNPKIVLEWDTMLQILIDICQCMAYLYNQNYHFTSFDPRRMHLTNNWRIKIDISTALTSVEDPENKKFQTSLWTAPEVLVDPANQDEKSNIYSLGLIIWQIMVRKLPYDRDEMTEDLAESIIRGDCKLKPPSNVAPSLAKLMASCLGRHSERSTFKDVLTTLEKIKKIGPPPIIVDEKTAQRYCKVAKVFAFQTADPCQVEKEWGKQRGKEGCWIICNPSEDDLYLCDEDVFKKTYQKVPGKKNQFRKVGEVLARLMEKPFALKTSDGVQYGLAGDYILRDAKKLNGDLWVVDAATFKKIYKLSASNNEYNESGQASVRESLA